MNDPTWKTIGILGGMGPESTAELYRKIIKICQKEYACKYDSDFPPMFIYNMPLPDIVENKGDQCLIPEVISNGLAILEGAGCDFIAVPCNTVFAYIGPAKCKLPLLNIVEETSKYVIRRGINKIGVIATKNTVRNRLYEKYLENIDIIQLPSESQDEVNDIIMRILSGEKTLRDKKCLQNFIEVLAAEGAEDVVLGCTELPLLISQSDSKFFLIDTLQVLAEVTVEKARVSYDKGGGKDGA